VGIIFESVWLALSDDQGLTLLIQKSQDFGGVSFEITDRFNLG
jgi:hypothetical protein